MKNLIRIGKVSSINYELGTVKVIFSDQSNIVTNNLPMLSFEYNMPKVNDLVLCLFLGNGISNGFCLGKYYNQNNMPLEHGRDIFYKDFFGEGYLKYDKQTRTLTISAENIQIEGNITVDGNLDVTGDVLATGTINGSNI